MTVGDQTITHSYTRINVIDISWLVLCFLKILAYFHSQLFHGILEAEFGMVDWCLLWTYMNVKSSAGSSVGLLPICHCSPHYHGGRQRWLRHEFEYEGGCFDWLKWCILSAFWRGLWGFKNECPGYLSDCGVGSLGDVSKVGHGCGTCTGDCMLPWNSVIICMASYCDRFLTCFCDLRGDLTFTLVCGMWPVRAARGGCMGTESSAPTHERHQ